MSSYAGYLVETLVTLFVVCLVAFLVIYGARRLGVGRAAGPVRLVGQLPLDRRRAIYAVKVGEKVFVVGVGDGVFTKLGEMTASEVPAEPARPAPAFADVLAKVLGRGESRAPRADAPKAPTAKPTAEEEGEESGRDESS